MSSVGEDFPREQARLRRLLGVYKEIGPAGAFGSMMIEQSLKRADEAAMSGDPVAIIRAYQDMKGCS